MYDLGKIKYFLSVEVVQSTKGIFISKKKYAKEVLKGFDMESCNPVKNPIVSRFKLVKDEGSTSIDAGGQSHVFDCHQTRLGVRGELIIRFM